MVVELTVDRIVAGGDGLAQWDGLKVFVRGAAAGERVSARVLERKRDYAVARTEMVLDASPVRRSPPCRYFGDCGGCQLQHITYDAQLEAKRALVDESLRRLGRLEIAAGSVAAAPAEWRYRNKTQYPVNQYGIGFYRRASHHVVDTKQCLLHPETFDRARNAFVAAFDAGLERPYSELHRDGNIRHLVLRTGHPAGAVHATVVTRTERLNPGLVESVMHSGTVQAVLHSVNQGPGNRIIGSAPRAIAGDPRLTMAAAGSVFEVSPGSFFQVNAPQAERLVDTVLRLAEPQAGETALDLYCGVGLTSLALARHCARVVGVELDPGAVADARANAAAHGIDNAEFICADAEDSTNFGRAELVVLDPPRKGCSQETLAGLAALGPRRMVYVSCNPATLARDLAALRGLGYEAQALELIDMFPQTAHVESVCLVTRRV
jgi:23S rRNA (uracil1939-C5)-methyltransferase